MREFIQPFQVSAIKLFYSGFCSYRHDDPIDPFMAQKVPPVTAEVLSTPSVLPQNVGPQGFDIAIWVKMIKLLF